MSFLQDGCPFKGLFKSKVAWFNALSIGLVLLDILGQTNIIKDNPDYSAIVVAVGNILLRFVTRVPLSDK